MKMTEILNALTKEQLITLLDGYADREATCSMCPVKEKCKAKASGDDYDDDRTCAQFLLDEIEEDRGA